MSKVRIGILRGGPSDEHEASMASGAYCMKNLEGSSDIFIDKQGQWYVGGAPKTPIEALQHFDVIVNSLHGKYGEDGEVSKILEQSGVPHIGNPVRASATTYHKGLFKKTLKDLKVKTPLYKELNLSITDDFHKIAKELFGSFPLPAVVKPMSNGSSVGVGIATNYETLIKALREVVLVSNDILVEEYISGAEVVSGFVDGLRGQETYVLLPIHVLTDEKKETLSKNKLWTGHLDSLSRSLGSYNLDLHKGLKDEHKKEIEEVVKKVKDHLGMRHYATFDFIVSPRRGVYLIEADTSPHVGEKTPIISSLKEAGVKVEDFFKHLVEKVTK